MDNLTNENFSFRDKIINAMKAKGHMPKVNDKGEVDFMGMAFDIHNGPECEVCGWDCCEHCMTEEGLLKIDACSCIDGSTSFLCIEG